MTGNVIDHLQQRGFIEQMTDVGLRDYVGKPRNVYVGFDPTADSLHLGSLVPIVALEWFRRFGHTPYVILGGATGRIGDPSGKSTERPLLDDQTLQDNIRALAAFFYKMFGDDAIVLNNDDWFRSMTVVDFLRDIGKLFRVGQMLSKESVRLRLTSEEGLSFTEFSYQVLQGYDFAYLHAKRNVTIQMGATDQWGNITAGIEYNRKRGQAPIYGITFPLLTKSDGKKFGKTEEGAIWLSADKCSPYQFYQALINVADADVVKLLRMLTFLDMREIESMEQEMKTSSYIPNSAQRLLAEEVTRFIHGEEALQRAQKVTQEMAPGATATLSRATFDQLILEVPHTQLPMREVLGSKIPELTVRIGLTPSKSEAVRLIKNGGLYLNNQRVEDPSYAVAREDLIEGVYLLFSAGKKKRFLVYTQND
jgi:tyrosyl-tRNA synthetase